MDDQRTRLDDTTRCPDCGLPLGSWRCVACGLELRGPTAQRLYEASVQAEHWLGERRNLISVLRDEGEARRRVETPAVPPPAVPPTPP
ncbi:MAG TPA: hypothetical protein VFD41_01755, partial [Actinomycetales bacterium]|nr:hypothetical protein [Actinomycetales bacterium]